MIIELDRLCRTATAGQKLHDWDFFFKWIRQPLFPDNIHNFLRNFESQHRIIIDKKMSYHSYKWISSLESTGGRNLAVNPTIEENVFKEVLNSSCNIISIFGRARQGKSFLMNCLAGEKEIFRISNQAESVRGIVYVPNFYHNRFSLKPIFSAHKE